MVRMVRETLVRTRDVHRNVSGLRVGSRLARRIMGPEYANHRLPMYRAQVEGVSGWVDGGLFTDKKNADADAERLGGIYNAPVRAVQRTADRESSETMTDQRLDPIRQANDRLDEADEALHRAVREARRGPKPVTWQAIGDELGISRQAAYQRFTGPVRGRSIKRAS